MKNQTGFYVVIGLTVLAGAGVWAYNKYIKENKAVSFISWVNSKI